MGKIEKSEKPFSLLLEKEIRKIDKDDNDDIVKVITQKKFIDSARFNATSLSIFVDNLSAGTHKLKYTDFNFLIKYCR